MEQAKTGHIHTYCQPNAIATFKEYLIDYASDKTKAIGNKAIEKGILNIDNDKMRTNRLPT